MKRVLCIILMCLLCLTNGFAQQNKVADRISQALNLLQNDQPDEAEKILLELQSIAPQNIDVHNLLGVIADRKGNQAEAEKQFRQALKINPKAISSRANLGVLLAKSGRRAEAIQTFETVIRLAPDHPEATITLGLLYNAAGDYPKAAAYLKKANAIQPNSYDIILNLGTAFFNLKSFDEAAQNFELAARLAPNSAEPFYWLGMCAAARAQDDSAVSLLEKALNLKPDYAEANFMLGEIYAKYKKYAVAKNYYAAALKQDSTKPVYFIRLGGMYLFLKDFANAAETFQKASESFPKVPEIHYFYAVTIRSSANFDLALAEVKKALAIKETADSLGLFGAILIDQNQFAEAEAALRKALALNPKHLNSLTDLGRLLVKNRRYQEAVPVLQQAAALSANPDIHYQLFLAFSRLKLTDDAARELKTFKQLSGKEEPDNQN